MRKKIFSTLLLVTTVCGCTTTQKSAGIGAAVGAGVGAIIGHQSGHRGEGALIGAALGGLGGAAVGKHISEKRFCPICGYTTTSKASFCPNDGTRLKIKKN